MARKPRTELRKAGPISTPSDGKCRNRRVIFTRFFGDERRGRAARGAAQGGRAAPTTRPWGLMASRWTGQPGISAQTQRIRSEDPAE